MTVQTVVTAESAAGRQDIDTLLQIDQDNIVHSWSSQRGYVPRLITRAEGCHIWDADGRRYLDMTSQAWYANIGHGDRRVIDAIAAQAGELAAVYRFGTAPKLRLAAKLLSLLPSSYQRVFLGCNGSDAIEVALKIARMVTGRQEVISFHGEYHGASMGATSITGLPQWRSRVGQPVPGTIFVPPPYFGSPLSGATKEETEENTLAHLKRTIQLSGPDTIAAVIGEPIITASLCSFPTQGFWKKVRAICDEFGLLLIADEVVTGFGRCGTFFARDYYDYEPDILCLGKGLTSGYLPVSAAVFKRGVSTRFDDVLLPHGLTYSGHPICCAAALANIEVIEHDNLVSRAGNLSREFASQLATLQAASKLVRHTDSLGLFGVIELAADNPHIGERLMSAAEDRGIIVRGQDHRVSMAPPLTISAGEIEFCMRALADVLSDLA